MNRQRKWVGAVVLGALSAMVFAPAAEAQVRVQVGAGRYSSPGIYGSVNRGNSSYYRGYRGDPGYRSTRQYRSYRPSYSYSAPYVGRSTVYYEPSTIARTYPESYPEPAPPTYYYAPTDNRTAQLRIVLPRSDATVWLQGQQMSGTGEERAFVTPPLDPGRQFSYRVQASWMDGDRSVSREKEVTVESGRESLVRFDVRD